MHNHLLKYFSDILCAISEIESFLTIKGRRFDIFISDMMFYKSILMNIAIIGEAMNNILKIQPDIEISNARKIVDTRNYVIHGYDSLSPEILWNIVINHLPNLKIEIEKIKSNISII